MQFIKKYLKLFIGIGVLVLGVVVFFMAQRTSELESGNLKKWLSVSNERRTTAVRVVNASDENVELIVACVNKMAMLPDSGEFMVSDAVRLCSMGIQLKENN